MAEIDLKEETDRIHYDLTDAKHDQVQIELPIRRIHNIPVDVSLVFKLYHAYLRIMYKDAPSQRLSLYDSFDAITPTMIHTILTDLPTTLYSIKYDPYLCFYITPKKDKVYARIVQNIPHIECAFGECSVCYAMTRNRTLCKHYLCYSCDAQITDEAYKSFKPFPKCPMCREDIS